MEAALDRIDPVFVKDVGEVLSWVQRSATDKRRPSLRSVRLRRRRNGMLGVSIVRPNYFRSGGYIDA